MTANKRINTTNVNKMVQPKKVRGLDYYYYRSYSDFLELREKFSEGPVMLGSSEIGIALDRCKWKPGASLFLEKVGLWPKQIKDNTRMYRGRVLEQEGIITNYFWRFTDPDMPISDFNDYDSIEHFIDRVSKNIKRPELPRKVNAIVFNPKYPWLYASQDYEIHKSKKGVGVLELKVQDRFTLATYANGIPYENILQIQEQMMVAERDWGELFQLVDAHTPISWAMYKRDILCNIIKERTEKFCHDANKAKTIVDDMINEGCGFSEIDQAICHLVPPIKDAKLNEEFLKEKDKLYNRSGTIPAQPLDIKYAKKFAMLKKWVKEKTELEKVMGNYFRKRLQETNAEELDFGDKNKVYWKGNGLNINRKYMKELINEM